jgi:hypothetical protein
MCGHVAVLDRTAFESTNGLTIMDMTNSSVRSTQGGYLVLVYADSDGQRYMRYDLMSVSDIRDAVERMQDFGIGTMTVPYNTL